MTNEITVPRATWDALREALKDISEESYDKGAVECANHALTAANAVSAQFMGFDVVIDPTMPPDTMKLVQPQAPVGRFVSDGDCGHLELVPHQGPPLAGGQYVFAGPQVQAPLTDAQILEAIRNAPKMKTNYAGWVLDQRIAWGRAILAAANGIGGTP